MDKKLETIILIACVHYSVDYAIFMNGFKSRKSELIKIRQFIMWLYKLNTGLSLATIGAFFNKDHATCLSANRKVTGYRETNKYFLQDSNELILKIREVYPEFNRPVIESPEPTITIFEAANKMEAAILEVLDQVGLYRMKKAYDGDLINVYKSAQN